MKTKKRDTSSQRAAESLRICSQCDCACEYADAYASDYGLLCEYCALNEIDSIAQDMIRRSGIVDDIELFNMGS